MAPNIRYGFKYREITDVRSNASTLIREQAGERYISEVGHVTTYDVRDSKLTPTEGFVVSIANDVAGLGGSAHYFRTVLRGTQYYPFAPQWVGSVGGRVGHIVGLGEDVNIGDRFFLGGETLRGFKTAGAGPRDLNTSDPLGGEWVYNGSVELRTPLGLPDELGIHGRVFSDFGSLGSVNPSLPTVEDTGSIRVSVGVGVGWASPFGPISMDFGVPVVKEDFDKNELFRVNFGTRF